MVARPSTYGRPATTAACRNYFTGSKQKVKGCLTNPSFELVRQDVTFPLYVEDDEI